MVLMGTLGLATCFVRIPGFWSGYVLDIVEPARNYIVIRGLFAQERAGMMSRIFTPEVTLGFIVSVCFLVEAAQYLELYDALLRPL